jgi:hypothetical protein
MNRKTGVINVENLPNFVYMYLVVENKSVKNLCLSLLPTLCRLATGDSQAVKKIILTKFDVVDFQVGFTCLIKTCLFDNYLKSVLPNDLYLMAAVF